MNPKMYRGFKTKIRNYKVNKLPNGYIYLVVAERFVYR